MSGSSRHRFGFTYVGAASRAARNPRRRPPRLGGPTALNGFTLVELLVVITIIGMLVALLLPAVQSVRENARTTQCATNLGELAKAMLSYDTSKGSFPGYLQYVKKGTNQFATANYDQPSQTIYVESSSEPGAPFSWATMLLSRVERQDIWDQIVTPDTTIRPPIRRLDIFICPSDSDALAIQDRPALSYVANTGAWDRDNSGNFLFPPNQGDAVANGLLFDLASYQANGNKAPTNRLSGISDGAATTLMLSENNHKTYDPANPGDAPLLSWLASGVPAGVEQHFGMVWVVNQSPQVGMALDNQEAINGNASDVAIFPSDKPLFARPASNHGDGVNVVFCDGHTAFLRDNIDYRVYQQLLTTKGSKCVDPMDHSNVASPSVIYQFRTAPPLSNQDYQ